MTDQDQAMNAAIAAEERALLQSIGEEPPYLRQLLTVFSGRTGWVSVVLMVAQTVLFIASVWAAWRFFESQDVLIALKWGISAATLMLMSLMLKLALWPVIHFNRLGDRLTRIELLFRQ